MWSFLHWKKESTEDISGRPSDDLKPPPEPLPVTQNPTGSVFALPLTLPAETLRGGVYRSVFGKNITLTLTLTSDVT